MMKFILLAAVSILSTLASGLALPDLTPRATAIRPELAIVVKEDSPDTAFPPTNIVEVSRRGGAHTVETFLCFVLSACTGVCTISFSNAISASGSRTMQLFSTFRCPVVGDSMSTSPPLNAYLGTFLVPPSVGLDPKFPCPATTTNYGFAVVPVGDYDSVTWDITNGGFIITCG